MRLRSVWIVNFSFRKGIAEMRFYGKNAFLYFGAAPIRGRTKLRRVENESKRRNIEPKSGRYEPTSLCHTILLEAGMVTNGYWRA